MTTFEIVLVIALLVITPLAIMCGWHLGRASVWRFNVAKGRALRMIAQNWGLDPLPGESEKALRKRVAERMRNPHGWWGG